MKTLPLLTLTVFLGCNSLSGHIEQQVDSKVETAKQDMNAEVEKVKQRFLVAYKAAEITANKSALQELQMFRTTLANTDNYLDSIKTEMDKLDEKDVRTLELVKAIFLYRGVGDTIINKFKASIAEAQFVSRTDTQRAAIRAASDSLGIEPNPDSWKEQMFGLTNPLGASMELYGLRMELYKIGMKALRG